jgi:endonuclease YncB( thermonuclease family)
MRKIGAVLAAAVMAVTLGSAPADAAVRRVAYVVDGDTIRLSNGAYVRLIGIDTPERGQCGYRAATRNLDRRVGSTVRLVNPDSVRDRDYYGRLLRYVHASGVDTGYNKIRRGLADARYDGLDGYQRHPRQPRYRAADRTYSDIC